MRLRSTVFAALTTTITVGLAGCGQQAAVQSPERDQGLSVTTVVPRSDPAASWAEGYCGAVTHLIRALAVLPSVDPSTPQRASRTAGDLLSSVVGGLVSTPVIAVPTSVGYGASFGGVAALLAALNSCASGVTVVNIDNGFGAAVAASRINHASIS